MSHDYSRTSLLAYLIGSIMSPLFPGENSRNSTLQLMLHVYSV